MIFFRGLKERPLFPYPKRGPLPDSRWAIGSKRCQLDPRLRLGDPPGRCRTEGESNLRSVAGMIQKILNRDVVYGPESEIFDLVGRRRILT